MTLVATVDGVDVEADALDVKDIIAQNIGASAEELVRLSYWLEARNLCWAYLARGMDSELQALKDDIQWEGELQEGFGKLRAFILENMLVPDDNRLFCEMVDLKAKSYLAAMVDKFAFLDMELSREYGDEEDEHDDIASVLENIDEMMKLHKLRQDDYSNIVDAHGLVYEGGDLLEMNAWFNSMASSEKEFSLEEEGQDAIAMLFTELATHWHRLDNPNSRSMFMPLSQESVSLQ